MRPAPVGPDLAREPTVSVGLIVDTAAVELGATTDYQLLDGSGGVLHRLSSRERATIRAGAADELIVEVGGRETRTGGTVVARPADEGFVSIGGETYRGTALVRSNGAGRLTAINQVDMENYLLGVVPYEIGRVGPELLEAAKAQAVAARTYALRYLGRRSSLGFDVFATVQDQVYGGAEGEHEPVSRAVRETAGEILTYEGEPVEAFYHSTCSGQTAAIHEVWPGEAPRPYLISITDVDPATGEAFDVTSNRFRWTQRWTADELQEILGRTLADSLPAGVSDVGEVRDFQILDRTTSGRIRTMRITTSTATFDVGGDRIRWVFLTPSGAILNSSRFDIVTERGPDGEIEAVVAEGMGWGHGIGMCQVGAMGRARAGQDYRTILTTYYPGAEVVDLY
ncbi:MAG: SpoIID/LytB domain-containing protein [Gemmatimonadota bacterium]